MSIDTLINSSQAFVSYNATLYFNKENDTSLKQKMLEDARIMKLISELKNWPGKVLSSHKSAQQPFHQLAFLADIGLSIDDNEIYSIIKKILEHRDEQGIPQLPMNIGTSYIIWWYRKKIGTDTHFRHKDNKVLQYNKRYSIFAI